MKVADILKTKDTTIFSVSSNETVFNTLKLMSENNIGAVPVINGKELAGIFSERDYARKVVLKGRNSHETSISEVMTEKVITIEPSDPIEKCMELMSNRHIRHLPVIENNTVIGIISIGDVVNAIIAQQKETIDHLKNYIMQ